MAPAHVEKTSIRVASPWAITVVWTAKAAKSDVGREKETTMTPEGYNDLFPAIEAVLRNANEPLDCNQIFRIPEVNQIAPSANRVSDYLGILFRRGMVSRVPSDRSDGSKSRWKYVWRNKDIPAIKQHALKVVDYAPKAILDRPNIYISEDGVNINIELPHLSITIKKK